MSHTFESNGVTFRYNSDFSGDVAITISDNGHDKIKILAMVFPVCAIFEFVMGSAVAYVEKHKEKIVRLIEEEQERQQTEQMEVFEENIFDLLDIMAEITRQKLLFRRYGDREILFRKFKDEHGPTAGKYFRRYCMRGERPDW